MSHPYNYDEACHPGDQGYSGEFTSMFDSTPPVDAPPPDYSVQHDSIAAQYPHSAQTQQQPPNPWPPSHQVSPPPAQHQHPYLYPQQPLSPPQLSTQHYDPYSQPQQPQPPPNLLWHHSSISNPPRSPLPTELTPYRESASGDPSRKAACEDCHNRKVKCDRTAGQTTPCSNCVRRNKTCVPHVPQFAGPHPTRQEQRSLGVINPFFPSARRNDVGRVFA